MVWTITERAPVSGTSNTPTSGTFTPVSNAVLFAAVFSNGSGDQSSPAGFGLTWEGQLINEESAQTRELRLYRAATGATPSNDEFSVSLPASNDWTVHLIEVSGGEMGNNGLDIIAQLVRKMDGANTATSWTLYAQSFLDPNNAVLAFWGPGLGGVITPEAGYTVGTRLFSPAVTPTVNIIPAWLLSEDTASSAAWVSNSHSRNCLLELRIAGSAAIPPMQKPRWLAANRVTGGGQTTIATSSVTPNINELIKLEVLNDAGSGIAAPLPSEIVTDTGLTFVQIATQQFFTGNRVRQTLYRAMKPSGLSAGTVTVNFGTGQSTIAINLIGIPNANTSGTDGSGAIVQVVTKFAAANGLTLSIAAGDGWVVPTDSENAVIGFWGSTGNGDDTWTPQPGFMQLVADDYRDQDSNANPVDVSTVFTTFRSQAMPGGVGTASLDITIDVSVRLAGIAVEIKPASIEEGVVLESVGMIAA